MLEFFNIVTFIYPCPCVKHVREFHFTVSSFKGKKIISLCSSGINLSLFLFLPQSGA